MSERHNKHGRREVGGGYLARYKAWLSGLSRGQKIRYRILQVATAISVMIILGFLALQAWIRMPTLPDLATGKVPGNSAQGDISFENSDLPDVAQSGRKAGIYTFLLAGKDVASGGTDTMLLLSYDTNEKKIWGVNLPRDTMINTSATSKRLNAVYARNRGDKSLSDKERVGNGMAALKKEAAKITGITPDFYVLVEWEAIGELVDAIGGVEFEVPFDMDYDDPYQDLHIHQKAGLRLLNGDDAMQVIRHRKNNDGSHSGGDVGRLDIQQDFLKAVAKKCLQPATFLKIPELAKIFTENVTTDLTVGNILAFAQKAMGMDPDTGVSFQTLPLADSFLYNSAALVTLDGEGILEIVNAGMNPYQRDIEEEDLQLVYRKSNGSFGVTNAELADAKMGRVPVKKPEPVPEVEEPEVPIDPDTEDPLAPGQTGDSSQGGEGTVPDSSVGTDPDPDGSQPPVEGGDSSQSGGETAEPGNGGAASSSETTDPSGSVIGTIDPDQVLPDPNAGETTGTAGSAEEVPAASQPEEPVLPSQPEAAAPAA